MWITCCEWRTSEGGVVPGGGADGCDDAYPRCCHCSLCSPKSSPRDGSGFSLIGMFRFFTGTGFSDYVLHPNFVKIALFFFSFFFFLFSPWITLPESPPPPSPFQTCSSEGFMRKRRRKKNRRRGGGGGGGQRIAQSKAHLQGDNLMDVMDSAFSIHNLYGILSSKVQMHNECLS